MESTLVAMVERAALISLYRSFIRVAQGMPTGHRREFIVQKAREEFRSSRLEEEPIEQERLYKYGVAMLDQANEQRLHLMECMRENLLDFEMTPEEKAKKSGRMNSCSEAAGTL